MGKQLIAIALCTVAVTACGKGGGDKAAGTGSGSGSGSAVPALAVPALGVDAPRRFNFPYGKGAEPHKRALAAVKARDWAAVRDAATAALAADPDHLDAHRLAAVAAVQLGTPAAAVDHLATILAADWFHYHAIVKTDADLAPLWPTPEGAALTTLDTTLGAAAAELAKAGPHVLARRSGFKWPSKAGAQWATTRGELYAVDLAGKRYLRLTHTGDAIAAVLVAPSGAEVAVIGYDKVEMPDPAAAGAPPLLARAWVEAYDPATWAPTTKRATIGKGRAAAVAYGAGDQLLVAAVPASGRWELAAPAWAAIDRNTGKTTKLAATAAPPADAPRAIVTLDEAWIERPLAGIDAAWSAPTAAAPALASQLVVAGGKPIEIPESGKTARDSITRSPQGARLAFVTWTDPCAADAKRSLYVVDVATGQLKHLLTEASRFRSRWLDDDRLLYEDGKGHLRIWSAAEKRELQKLEDRHGLALDALDARTAPLCKSAPPVIEPDPGTEDTLPPEEPMPTEEPAAGEGPVTTPT